ncbi:MAG: energy transducer TonB [Rikenellaceae bacterium]|jgi:protein TonB|nr:energy transducer TonB [Rikenellaceae bacterium]
MPKFDGDDVRKFRNWVTSNPRYPEEAAEKNIQGRVIVSFIVEKDGSVSNVKTEKSVDPLLDNGVMRVVAMSPEWTPGTQRGQPVCVRFSLPLYFALSKQ